MKTVVQKFSLLKWPVSCLLAMLLIFSPLTALAQNTSIDNVDNAKPSAASTAEMKKDSDVVMVFVIGNSSYTVNGELMVMDVSPTIIEGRTLLPIRFAATPLGAEVGWNEADRKVTVALGATEIELWIGQNNALVNGNTVPIDADNPNVKPLILNDRTMLPLRFVTENLGCGVGWNEATQKVTITKAGAAADTGSIPDTKTPSIIPGDIKVPQDIIKDLGKITEPDVEDPDKKIPDVSKLPLFKTPEVLNINDVAYYENYYGTVLTTDTGLLTSPNDTYKWGVTNNKDMNLQYFAFFLKPAGNYESFRASFYLDSSAKADLVMNIRKETKDGMVLKSLKLKPGETLKNVTVDISGVNKLCIESEIRINHGTVKKIIVGEPVFINNK